MPGTVITRDGALRECQGAYLVDWKARGATGQPMGQGTSFVAFSPAGRMLNVVGFWSP
ncbi:MAG: hypothetical protein HC872_07935 [Gammaproteobacteria bacterium]|nr:hypothetical protein [Gammaproteobacteria bacterium]